jgi:hypothetical protein
VYRVLPEPLEDLEAVHTRHFEIKEKEPGRQHLLRTLEHVYELLAVAGEGE